jgi:hypothetical protein
MVSMGWAEAYVTRTESLVEYKHADAGKLVGAVLDEKTLPRVCGGAVVDVVGIGEERPGTGAGMAGTIGAAGHTDAVHADPGNWRVHDSLRM